MLSHPWAWLCVQTLTVCVCGFILLSLEAEGDAQI